MATVRIEDCRKLSYCRGGLLMFLTRHGLSWRKLVKQGYPEEELLRIDNAFVRKAVECARQRETSYGPV